MQLVDHPWNKYGILLVCCQILGLQRWRTGLLLMYMRIGWYLLVGLLILTSGGKRVWAAGFSVASIGSVSTNNQQLSHWWYTGNSPVFRGEAGPGADIIVDIDGSQAQIAADSAGNWVYSATGLSEGDHSISFASGGSTIAFTLTIGTANVDWGAVEAGGSQTLPTVGIILPGIILMSGGTFLISLGKKLLK